MSRVSKNITYNVVGQVLLLLVSFVSIKLIFSRLGGDILGIIYFSALLNRIISGLLLKGVYTTTVREVSARFESEPKYIDAFVRTGSALSWSLFVFFSILTLLTSGLLLEKWLVLGNTDAGAVRHIFSLFVIGAFFAFPNSFYASLLEGIQRMEISNSIEVVLSIIDKSGMLIVLALSYDTLHLAIWLIFSKLLKTLVYLITTSYFFGKMSLVPSLSYNVAKRNVLFFSKMAYFSIFVFISKTADRIIISKMLPVSIFGYYGYVYELVSRFLLLSVAVGRATYPSFCALYESGKADLFANQYKKLQDLVSFGMAPVFSAIPFLSLPLLAFIFDEEVAKNLILPIILLGIGAYMNSTLSLPHRVLLATGKPEIPVKQYLYACLISVPLNAGLIYLFSVTGAATSLILVYSVGYIYAVPHVYRALGKSPRDFYTTTAKIMLLVAISYGSVFNLLMISGISTLSSLLTGYTIASAAYLVMGYYFMSKGIREALGIVFTDLNKGIRKCASL